MSHYIPARKMTACCLDY